MLFIAGQRLPYSCMQAHTPITTQAVRNKQLSDSVSERKTSYEKIILPGSSMANKFPYFDELIKDISSDILDTNCEEDILVRLADMFSGEESRSIARKMGVTVTNNGSHTRVKDHKVSLLTSTQFFRATYRELMLKLYNLGRVDLVEAVLRLLKSQDIEGDVFTQHLKEVYHAYVPRRRHVWPPSKPCKFIELSLKEVKDRQYDGATQHLKEASPETETIELKDILSPDQTKGRKIVVVEGLSGIGKTTLVLNTCKQWADGVLLTEYKYVIIVELQLIQNTKSSRLSDILPISQNQLFIQAFEKKIQAILGKSTLFICDGWDELSSELQDPRRDSVICNLLFHPERLSVQKSTVMITSRPDSTACLDRITTFHAQILGFTPAETREYFTEVLHDPVQVDKLCSEMYKYPSLYGTCYVPLNAVILAHIFKILKGTLPHTLHDAYCKLVLICIIHEEYHDTGTLDVSSFYDLPPEMKSKLDQVAMLAYKGCRYCKAIFTNEDLEQDSISTLGLLQPVESFTFSGKAKTYSFVHLSIQQLLAAFHISQWPPTPQAEVFTNVFLLPMKMDTLATTINKELNQLQLGHFTVIQHASGFTNLRCPQLRKCILNVVQDYCINRRRLLIVMRHTISTCIKRSFIMLMRCLYDAKNEPISKEVASKLKGEINLVHTHVEPYDCLSLGYLAHHFTDEVEISFFESAIDDSRIELFCKEFSAVTVTDQEQNYPKLKLCLQSNSVHDEGVKALVLLLKNQLLVHLNLEGNSLSSIGANLIAVTLRMNQSLTQLDLSNNSISDEGAACIALALKTNSTLLWLALNSCDITDDGFAIFAEILQINHTLQTLELSDNAITDTGLMVLSAGLENNRGITTLRIDPDIADSTPTGGYNSGDGTFVVNLVRKKSHLPKTVGVHHTLSKRKLSSNITSEGIRLFVWSLFKQKCVTTLDIGIFYGKNDPVIQEEVTLINQERNRNGIQELTLTWDTETIGTYRMNADLSNMSDILQSFSQINN